MTAWGFITAITETLLIGFGFILVFVVVVVIWSYVAAALGIKPPKKKPGPSWFDGDDY